MEMAITAKMIGQLNGEGYGFDMSCYYPVGCKSRAGPAFRPCGNCIGCRLEQSRQWAVRATHEAQLHDENSFITLTYSEEALPNDLSLRKEIMQAFLKKLRRKLEPTLIRFLGCGEYGDGLGSRPINPHYHLCIFGYSFPDREPIHIDPRRAYHGRIKGDHTLYRSDLLEKVWTDADGNSLGFSTVGDLSFESAAYVARYVCKKITGPSAREFYQGRIPEFAFMSRMPGLGRRWIEKFKGDVYPKDYYHINGIRQRPVKYYDTWLEKNHPEVWKEVKGKRIIEQERLDNEGKSVRTMGWNRKEQKIKYKKRQIKCLERSI